jgi:hypothetical protein
MRPVSSSFMPRKIRWRTKLPDCETPRTIAVVMRLPSGFGVPKSSAIE